MSTVNLTLVPTPFTVTPAWTVEQFHQAIIASITTSTTSSNVVLGQVDGVTPSTYVGPWLNGTTWYAWDSASSTYKPATIKIGDADFQITLTGAPTANRTATFPDKDGVVALTSDVYNSRATTTLGTTGAVTVDWSVSQTFASSLTGNLAISNTNSLPGQEIRVAIYNPAAHTVTWSGVFWPAGAAPTQTTGAKTDVYCLYNVGGSIYGKQLLNYSV